MKIALAFIVLISSLLSGCVLVPPDSVGVLVVPGNGHGHGHHGHDDDD
jgi:hypothetical protein